MNLFQIIALTIFGALLAWELWKLASHASLRGSFLRVGVWIAALVVVAYPDLAARAAQLAGIGRGADFVLYCVSLSLLLCVFFLYARQVALERRLTDLVRHQALQQARRGRAHPADLV